MGQTYVVDGSVALKWFLDDEKGIGEARHLLSLDFANEGYLIAPAILSYELPNGLLKALRRGRITPERLGECLKELAGLHLTLFLNEDVAVPEIMEMCRTFGLSFYDASYLALARERDAVIAVGDLRLAEAAEAMGIRTLLIGIESN